MRTPLRPRRPTTSRIRWKSTALILAVGCLATVSSAGASVKLHPSATPARTAATCTADEQAANQAALTAYVKRMARDRKAYFRKHHDKAHRQAFVKRQQAKLKALQAAAACQVEAPPPTPPPPPPYQSGHYAGKTSQQEDFEFDVSADGTILMNLVTGQINESCQDFNLFGGDIHATGNVTSISSDGNFSISEDYSGTFSNDGTPFQRHLAITGHVSGTSATGTLLESTTATIQGMAESCTSNPQTWSASKTG
jgi:hypothetical protein